MIYRCYSRPIDRQNLIFSDIVVYYARYLHTQKEYQAQLISLFPKERAREGDCYFVCFLSQYLFIHSIEVKTIIFGKTNQGYIKLVGCLYG